MFFYLDILTALVLVLLAWSRRHDSVADLKRRPFDQAVAVGLFAGLISLMFGYAGMMITAVLSAIWAVVAVAVGFTARRSTSRRVRV